MTTHTDSEIIHVDDSTSYFLIGEDVAAKVDGMYFLNEENVFVADFEDAAIVLSQKAVVAEAKKQELKEEAYSDEDAIRLLSLHNKRVTQNAIAECQSAASSKLLTNDPAVLDLRESGVSVADKYLFVLENNEMVFLGRKELELVRLFDGELLEHARKSADNLKQILKGIY